MTGLLNLIKERTAAASRDLALLAKKEAVDAKAKLTTAIVDGGQPLIVALGNMATAGGQDDRIASVRILINRIVALARAELGNQVTNGSKMRAAYYHLIDESSSKGIRKVLLRIESEGRPGTSAPRLRFVERESDHDDLAIKVALGEDAYFVENLRKDPPEGFRGAKDKDYISFISVPVRAGQTHFGMLTADSDSPLSEVDKELLILMAGILSVGLAMLDKQGIEVIVERVKGLVGK
ncbi:GAF domain-containing protein [Actinomadura scrupuli]|uniref:GAF domain-containing protein n=1 Tax=Actinomadura scrupuli TaxID=559629 RepID=UPI003D978EFB